MDLGPPDGSRLDFRPNFPRRADLLLHHELDPAQVAALPHTAHVCTVDVRRVFHARCNRLLCFRQVHVQQRDAKERDNPELPARPLACDLVVNTHEEPLADYLLEEAGVALLPGTPFGLNGAGHLRLSYANSIENIEKALERMQEALTKL